MAKLREYGAYPDRVGFLAPVLLDRVSTSLLLAIARDPGNNLLAHYNGGLSQGLCKVLVDAEPLRPQDRNDVNYGPYLPGCSLPACLPR